MGQRFCSQEEKKSTKAGHEDYTHKVLTAKPLEPGGNSALLLQVGSGPVIPSETPNQAAHTNLCQPLCADFG